MDLQVKRWVHTLATEHGTGLPVLPSALSWCCSSPWHGYSGVWADPRQMLLLRFLLQCWWGGLTAASGQRSNCWQQRGRQNCGVLVPAELHPLCFLQVSVLSSRDLPASPELEQLSNINIGSHPGKMEIGQHEVDKKLDFPGNIRIRSWCMALLDTSVESVEMQSFSHLSNWDLLLKFCHPSNLWGINFVTSIPTLFFFSWDLHFDVS